MPKKKHQLPKLLTIKQAAEILNVHSETLRRWDKQGKLKAIIVNERGDRRYDPKDLEKVINTKNK
jgi:excisionase family DNA binding protein